MQVKEVEEFIKAQQEQLVVTEQVETARVKGFYDGANKALSTLMQYIGNTLVTEEKAKAKEETAKKTK